MLHTRILFNVFNLVPYFDESDSYSQLFKTNTNTTILSRDQEFFRFDLFIVQIGYLPYDPHYKITNY